MPQVAHDPAFDSTLAILKDGYDFIWNRCRRFNSDRFVTRILGRETLCIHGKEAAELFYDERKFQRKGALPRRVVTSLFGKKAIQTLDGAAHRQRKDAFLSLMSPASLQHLSEVTAAQWRMAIQDWQARESLVLFDEAARILTKSVCAWAGVPLEAREAPRRARQLTAMVDAFGGVGPRLWRGKVARMQAQAWIMRHIVRARGARSSEPTALNVMAQLRGDDGRLLDARTAAVELLNVLRPTVAVCWYISFAALALHEHPEAREKLAGENAQEGAYRDLFMQEVRRFYPFTPYLGARVREDFSWRGLDLRKGTLVLLDVHGTNHDPVLWGDPERFRPERFQDWDRGAFSFIPQGGGSFQGHRCPGEWITMHNVALALHFLTKCCRYQLAPGQDLGFDLSRMPTRPRSGLVLCSVQATPALAQPAPSAPSRSAAADSARAAHQAA